MTIPKVPLGEFVEIKGGGTPSKSNAAFWGGNIPWVSPKDMKTWEICDSEDKITAEAVRESATNLIPPNATLIVNRSGILKHTLPVGITRRPVAINQDIKAILVSPRAHPEYVAHIIKAAEPIVLKWVRATTADNFPIDNLRELEIPLPPLDEQRRIAAILDKADALRRKRKRTIELIECLMQATYRRMFVEQASNSWPKCTVASLARDIRTGPFGSQLLHSEFVDEGIAVLGIDNVATNEFRWGERRHIPEEKYEKLRRYTVFPGDVLITIMGTCGRCAIVPENIPLAINTKHLCCITLDEEKCLPEFLQSTFLQHPDVLLQLGVQAKGAVMPGLNMGIIKSLQISLPPVQLQRDFVMRISKLRSTLISSRHWEAEGELLFSSLQHRAFSGQL
ncbi:restriction modification system DNA specificity domain [Rhodopseudomonas palustris TIE-1]|uniref:restriction endonuclease subunit S n=1 Tax=Rhodopseudomonas palustris TaxID=1076 RepID=UPI000164B0BF|nr:restriction endonuclease subunit S [Rhodopseudomonas palustris]ACF00040.1 restriction modification system DNA specificity domain [Rhodopseudomonas palustris TIE-1]